MPEKGLLNAILNAIGLKTGVIFSPGGYDPFHQGSKIIRHFLRYVAVHIQGEGYRVMTQGFRQGFHICVMLQGQGGERVPEIMEPVAGDPFPAAYLRELMLY